MNGAPIAHLDLDALPTGAAVKVLASQVSTYQADLRAVQTDVAEIKVMVRGAVGAARILVGLVPIVALAVSGIAWVALRAVGK